MTLIAIQATVLAQQTRVRVSGCRVHYLMNCTWVAFKLVRTSTGTLFFFIYHLLVTAKHIFVVVQLCAMRLSKYITFLCRDLYNQNILKYFLVTQRFVFVACDEYCWVGCAKSGAGKCDGVCNSGYSLSSENTCIGKLCFRMYVD